jgi:hypothetical protein
MEKIEQIDKIYEYHRTEKYLGSYPLKALVVKENYG